MQFTELDITILGLKSNEYSAGDILDKINEKLEIAVGEILYSQLTKQQLTDFLAVLESSPQNANIWLRENIPSYPSAIAAARKSIEHDINQQPNNKSKIDWLFV